MSRKDAVRCGGRGLHDEYFAVVFLAVCFIVLISALMRLLVSPSDSADYVAYVGIVKNLHSESVLDMFDIEPLSKGWLYIFVHFFRDEIVATDALHIANGVVFAIFFGILAALRCHDWRNVLLTFAMYGPLLLLVTLRATPAYLLVAYAFFLRQRHPLYACLVCLFASGFHVSALLALPPLLAANLVRDTIASHPRKFPWFDAVMVALSVFVYISLGFAVSVLGALSSLLDGAGAFSKFVVYTEVVDAPQSIFHYLYSCLALFFVLIAVFKYRNISPASIRYVSISFFIYAVLCISPVVAFRQSIFWLMPVLLVLPLKRYTAVPPVSFLFLIGCFGLCWVSLRGVMV